MTMARFGFQRGCVAQTTGLVLNVGAFDDPGRLRELYGLRVLNCDLYHASEPDKTVRPPSQRFDCREPWPWPDNSVQMVVLGDIIEHLVPDKILVALKEAARVATQLCVTAPEDDRPPESGDPNHITVVTEDMLRNALDAAGWVVKTWQEVDYRFVPRGFFVLAERKGV